MMRKLPSKVTTDVAGSDAPVKCELRQNIDFEIGFNPRAEQMTAPLCG